MRKASDQTLALPAALDQLEEAVAIIDSDCRIRAVNHAFCLETGQDAATLVGEVCRDILTRTPCLGAGDTPEACPVRECLRTGKRVRRLVQGRQAAPGAALQLDVVASPFPATAEQGEERLVLLERRDLTKLLRPHDGDDATPGKGLSGILPICAQCKNIRNEQGEWESPENYIHNHTAVQFTHGICPECRTLLYPDLNLDE